MIVIPKILQTVANFMVAEKFSSYKNKMRLQRFSIVKRGDICQTAKLEEIYYNFKAEFLRKNICKQFFMY